MTDKTLTIIEDAPAAVIAGSGEEYGIVNLNTLMRIIDAPRDPDAVRELAAEVYQLARGIQVGRISVVALEL
jgi:hypothetical protein